MVRPVYQGRITAAQDDYNIGLTDLAVVVQSGGARIVAWAPGEALLVALAPGQGALATISDTLQLGTAQAEMANRSISVIEHQGLDLVVTGTAQGASTGYIMNTRGDFGGVTTLAGVGGPRGSTVDLVQPGNGALYGMRETGVVAQFAAGAAGGYTDTTRTIDVYGPTALAQAQIGSSHFVLAAGRDMGGVAAFRAHPGNGRLEATGAIGTDEGMGIMTPTALEVATLLGRTFVVLLSSGADGGEGGALSVMELTASGALVPVDHANDTRDTRFGSASALEVVEVAGRVQVIAGGGDDGISLFDLTPDGRLLHHTSIANDNINGLDNVAALVAAQVGDEVQLFTTSQTAQGIGQWSYDTGDMAAARQAGSAGGTLSGTSGDDLLAGGAGNDRLNGGAGDDILVGGAGRDTLTGGSGRDIFMLEPDSAPDSITDFEVGQDRIDMSRFRMLYSADQLGYAATSNGATLTWREQSITVTRQGGGTLTLEQLFPGGFNWAHHSFLPSEFIEDDSDWVPENNGGITTPLPTPPPPAPPPPAPTPAPPPPAPPPPAPPPAPRPAPPAPLPPAAPPPAQAPTPPPVASGIVEDGTGGADDMRGTWRDDILRGQGGNDTIEGRGGADSLEGGDGEDFLRGNEGDDYLHGNDDNDVLWGGDGNDTVIGGKGNDDVQGGDGDDELTGGNGDDTLIGGAGNDLFFAQAGDDVVSGGDGLDSIHLGIGNDVYTGDGSGSDTVRGLAGHDTITGGSDGDLLLGHLGHDVIYGAGGNDTILAGIAHDSIDGGDGDDLLDAAPGWDTLIGGNGNDTLIGGLGNDIMTGGAGADTFVFTARSGWDTVTDYEDGIDTLSITFAGQNFNRLTIAQDGRDVTIWYGSGGIVLENTNEGDLSATDFLFS